MKAWHMYRTSKTEPVPLVEVTRSGIVECRHRGSIAIVGRGKLVDYIGDPHFMTPERSTAKPFQILALLKGGGIEAFGLGLDEIAVMVSSHNGEPQHVGTVRRILKKGGIDERKLGCGTHPPFFFWLTEAIFRENAQGPQPIHNNCSGKHAGMLLLGKLLRVSLDEYWRLEHPIQQAILDEVAQSVEVSPSSISTGIDGCGVPTFNVQLDQLAGAYCKLALADDSDDSDKLGIVKRAMMAHPFMVAGSMRLDTDLMELKPLIAKAGAQAVYCLAIPSCKMGIAVKIESGSEEASECVAVEILNKIGVLTGKDLEVLEKYWHRPVLSCTGTVVGQYRPIF
ncbi:MAG: asparaginase [Chloroflexi bacterium]|nr:asparaginase [Chloroflexota bacterium]